MMYQGNWPCSKCDVMITELPFEPRGTAGLVCRACYAQSKEQSTPAGAQTPPPPLSLDDAPDIPDEAGFASEPAPPPPDELDGAVPTEPGAEKPKFSGDWTCATCGGSITSLPFEPRSTENLKCLDCFKASKA